jgi:hypothetical protein
MKAPNLDPACASAVLALVAAARAHSPEAPLAWLCGFAARASGESLAQPDPRREPDSATIGRVELTRRRES